jgi:hypothetical protein
MAPENPSDFGRFILVPLDQFVGLLLRSITRPSASGEC